VNRAGLKVRARRGDLALEPAMLLKPTPIAAPPPTTPAAAALPSAATPEEKAAVPAPAIPAPAAANASTAPSTAAAEALRTSIDSHGLVQLLKGTNDANAKDAGVRLSPAEGDDLAGKGWQAYQKGDLEHAAVYLGQAAESANAHPWVRYALGLADLALAKYPEAVQNWERVRKDVPTFEPVYFNLADGYMLQHDDDAALKVLRDAQGRFPKDSDVWNATGVLDIRRTALDAAVDSFRRATEAAPNDSLGYFNLARAYQMRGQRAVRYSSTASKWVGGNQDFQSAVNNYQKYISMGGPYVQQAKEALQVLNWK
jgi:tetratricopeptide (TPR) repeat protein